MINRLKVEKMKIKMDRMLVLVLFVASVAVTLGTTTKFYGSGGGVMPSLNITPNSDVNAGLRITQNFNQTGLVSIINNNNGYGAGYFVDNSIGVNLNYVLLAQSGNSDRRSLVVYRDLGSGNSSTAVAVIYQANTADNHPTLNLFNYYPTSSGSANIQNWYNSSDQVAYLANNGSMWISSWFSANSIIDRTPVYEGISAVSDLKAIKSIDGMIDHKSLPDIAKASYNEPVTEIQEKWDKQLGMFVSTPVQVGTIEKEGRSLGGMISVLVAAANEQQHTIEQLQDRNALLENELCKKDATYSFCVGV
jgi:hypothetical protein